MDVQEETNQPSVPVSNPSSPRVNKRRLVIVGSIAVLILLVLTFIIVAKKNASSTSPVANVNKTITPTPNLAAAVSSKWYIIKTQSYSVSVPMGWKPKAEPMQGGVSLLVEPIDAPEQPILVIESFNTPVSIQEKVNVFRAMGLKQEVVKIPSSQPVMLSGTWATRTIKGKTFETPTQERIVFIPHGNSIYGVKLYYSSSHPEKVYDDMLNKVLASFVSAS